MVFGSAIVGLAYVIVVYGFSVTSVKGIVMALAYCWGLVLAIYLMGHGLVAIPRRLIRTATPSRRLRRLQTIAPRLYEQLEEAEMSLEDVELQVAELGHRKTGSAVDYREWIEDLVESTNTAGAHPRPGIAASAPPEARIVPTVITKKYMADLTRRLVRARHTRSRYLSEWNRLLQRYTETQAVLNSAGARRLELGKAPQGAGRWERTTVLTPYARYLLYFHVVPATRLVLGVVLAAASVAIVWSELVKAALPSASLIRLTVVHHWTGDKGQVGFAGQLIATVWILYMCAAALTSVTEVKVWRGRALVKRNTAHESAFWYASQVARLSVPLSYNFLTFLSKTVYEKTVFYEFLGRLINFTRLGTWFDYLLPTFILLPVLATLFGLYGRVRRLFGFGDLVESDAADDAAAAGEGYLRNYGTGSWREGRDLVERELNGTSIRQRRLEAAGRGSNLADGQENRGGPVMVVPGGRGGGYFDDPEDATRPSSSSSSRGATATTPFAVSPSSSGILPGGARTRTLGGVSSSSANRARRGGANDAYDDTAGDDDNFFQLLSHRMKNTIDTIDTQRWFQEIGQGFKKPKWMGAGDDGDGGGTAGPSQPQPSSDGAGIRRWFGGSSDGRIRL